MLVPVLLVLAVVFLVLGFAHVFSVILAIGLAVACVVLVLLLSGTVRMRPW